jgi:hypothetical protein
MDITNPLGPLQLAALKALLYTQNAHYIMEKKKKLIYRFH